MAKRRARPSRPEVPWPVVPAENTAHHERQRTAPGVAANGAATLRRHRPHIVEVMRQSGHLSSDQARVGILLSELYEATHMQGAAGLREYVDRWPDWAAIALSGHEAKDKFMRVWQDVPIKGRAVVWHVCCEDNAISPSYARGSAVDRARKLLQWALGEVLGAGH